MKTKDFRILQVNTGDIGGGAERISWVLHNEYKRRVIKSKLIVGYKRSSDSDVEKILNSTDLLTKRLPEQILSQFQGSVPRFIKILLRALTLDFSALKRWLGYEDFNFPDSRKILNQISSFDILHLHNLHGGYFDLSMMPKLSRNAPVLITLHDQWLLTGHCAHSIACRLWTKGCGNCPDLSRYPGIPRDRTRSNFLRKQRLLQYSPFAIATPCQWLADCVAESFMRPILTRVIPNGIDTDIFSPTEKKLAKRKLGLSENEPVILFVANQGQNNVYKDYSTIEEVIGLVDSKSTKKLTFIILGGDEASVLNGKITKVFVPYQIDPVIVAGYYQAADIYLHSAKADTFPNTVLEALSSGTPVIGSRIGGIPEQIKDGQTGFLVEPGDPLEMAVKMELLLSRPDIRETMSGAAAEDARRRFCQLRMCEDYLNLYREVIDSWITNKRRGNG